MYGSSHKHFSDAVPILSMHSSPHIRRFEEPIRHRRLNSDAKMRVMRLVTLCYHKVGTEAEEGRRLNIHPRRLESHVRFFLRRRYAFLRGKDLTEWPKTPSVCFTFDDGFVSTIVNGTPIFDTHKVPMSIYVVSSLVGSKSAWEGELARPLATWEQLREIQALGHEIGNHTATHPFLDKLTLAEQKEEIRICHEALLANDLKAESFCFPYGRLNAESSVALRENGYRIGLALGKRPPKETDSPLAMPRVVVAYSDGLPKLLYKLHVRPLLK
jgi:peptidoglycan/xylan/chitin deacetylase (PgdA/CDA1 family)